MLFPQLSNSRSPPAEPGAYPGWLYQVDAVSATTLIFFGEYYAQPTMENGADAPPARRLDAAHGGARRRSLRNTRYHYIPRSASLYRCPAEGLARSASLCRCPTAPAGPSIIGFILTIIPLIVSQNRRGGCPEDVTPPAFPPNGASTLTAVSALPEAVPSAPESLHSRAALRRRLAVSPRAAAAPVPPLVGRDRTPPETP